MATLDELVNAKELHEVIVNPGRGQLRRRSIYLAPSAKQWFDETLAGLDPAEADDFRPIMQVLTLFRTYISGEAMIENEDFKLMLPEENDVYELRTHDVRIYGWFYRPSIFIGVSADTMIQVHTVNGLASGHRNSVVIYRAASTLDPPLFEEGASTDDVLALGA